MTTRSRTRLSRGIDRFQPSRAPASPAVTTVTAAVVMNELMTTTSMKTARAQVPSRR